MNGGQYHKRVAVLVVQHVFHPAHLLYLSNPPSLPYFKCNGCNQHGQGFRYRCEECNVDIHGACALSDPRPPPGTSWTVIHHPLHAHPLILTDQNYHTFRCNCCKQPGAGVRFHCTLCGFDLHETCAIPARNPLVTSRGAIPARNPVVTSRGVGGPLFQQEKPPGLVIHHPIHCHPLRLSDEAYSTFRCNSCRQHGEGRRFQCTQCKFDLHDTCASVHCNPPVATTTVPSVTTPAPTGGQDLQRGFGTAQVTNVLGGIVRNALMHIFGTTVMNMISGGNGINLDFNFLDFDYGSFDFFYFL